MTIISEHKGVINFHLTTREDGNELWKKIGSTSLSWVAAATVGTPPPNSAGQTGLNCPAVWNIYYYYYLVHVEQSYIRVTNCF